MNLLLPGRCEVLLVSWHFHIVQIRQGNSPSSAHVESRRWIRIFVVTVVTGTTVPVLVAAQDPASRLSRNSWRATPAVSSSLELLSLRSRRLAAALTVVEAAENLDDALPVVVDAAIVEKAGGEEGKGKEKRRISRRDGVERCGS